MKLDVDIIRSRIDAARAGAGAQPRLLAYAVAGIGRFLFTSSRQPAILESSRQLRDFDRQVLEEPDGGSVFAGGGRGLLLVAQSRIAEVQARLRRQFEERTRGATLSLVDVAYHKEQEAACLHWLWQVAAARKDAGDPPSTALPRGTGTELCLNCHEQDGSEPAEPLLPDAEGRLLCASCKKLLKGARSQARARSLLSDVATAGRICVLLADGNGMGRLFESLPSLVALAAVSEAVKRIFPDALAAAAPEGDEGVVRPNTGGDDIRAIFGPARMDAFIRTLVGEVHRGLDEAGATLGRLPDGPSIRDGLRKAGLGVGMVVAPEKFPILRLLEVARSAEGQAKRYCRDQGARSAIQTFVLVSGNESLHTPPRPRSLVAPPAGRSEWDEMLHRARCLAAVPGSQRAALQDALRDPSGDRAQARNLFCYQIARSDEWQRYFDDIGVSWRSRDEVDKYTPEERDEALADLLLDSRDSINSTRGVPS